MTKRIPLPEPVARIYKATAELEALYPGRKFTPDGHLVGSIGEVIAAEALGLTLYPMSQAGHDAYDANGDVQIKMTAGTRVALYAACDRLVVLQVMSPEEAEIVYDGRGQPVWGEGGQEGEERTARCQPVAPRRDCCGGSSNFGMRPYLAARHLLSAGAARIIKSYYVLFTP
jgi:hypothetical protein